MNLHAPQALFLIGLLLYIAIRSVYQKRAGSSEKTVNRSNGRDRILVLLVILGQIVLPLLYVFSLWLHFANYGLAGAAALAAVVLVCLIRIPNEEGSLR
jgi:Na+/H+ antiporter NhaD/arsenite permease-like protein